MLFPTLGPSSLTRCGGPARRKTCKQNRFRVGYTTLWLDHFVSARFVVALFGVAHFVADPFWSGPFWREFHENNFFLLLFVLIFLIYKKFSIFHFSKTVERFIVYL